MTVNDPVPTLRLPHDENATPIDVGVSGWPMVATKSALRDVRAFQLSRPLRGSDGDAVMRRLEVPEGVRRNVRVRHHDEVEVALVGFEVANRERAVKIHADEVIVENTSRSQHKLLEHGVDLWIIGQG